MIVSRKEVVRALECCVPGLSTRENVDQSNCFCFRGKTVFTYNDEILCQQDFPVEINGAVPAKTLLDLLHKLPEDDVDITTTDTKLRIKGQGKRRSELNLVPDVVLPIGDVEAPSAWTEVPPAYSDALGMVADATDDDESSPLAYVHITPKGMEACDMHQAIRYEVATGLKSNVMVRGTSCKAVKGMGIAQTAETDNWVHWKTYTGLRVSVRKDTRDYPDLGDIFAAESMGEAYIPGSVSEILERAAPFMSKQGKGKIGIVDLAPGKIRVRAINQDGWYEEIKELEYDGPVTRFGVSPKHIQGALKYGLPCEITPVSLRIRGDAFVYALSVEEVG